MSATAATNSISAGAHTQTVELVAHPVGGVLGAMSTVTVQVSSTVKELRLIYDMRSRVAIKVPGLRGERPDRYDELWFRTCCELFIRNPLHPGPYLEFNFSPAGDFASYAFNDTLRGMRSHRWPGPVQAPAVTSTFRDARPHRLIVEASIPKMAIGGCTQLYPTVVLETVAGISLWAIWHPIDRPHFHHPENFSRALDIP